MHTCARVRVCVFSHMDLSVSSQSRLLEICDRYRGCGVGLGVWGGRPRLPTGGQAAVNQLTDEA